MFDRGFGPEVEKLLGPLRSKPQPAQCILVAATLTKVRHWCTCIQIMRRGQSWLPLSPPKGPSGSTQSKASPCSASTVNFTSSIVHSTEACVAPLPPYYHLALHRQSSRYKLLDKRQSELYLPVRLCLQPIRRLLDEKFPDMQRIETKSLHKGVAGARHTFLKQQAGQDKLNLLLQVSLLLILCLYRSIPVFP